jgi:2-polyprenyl-3-methyl-5-hydroxy-6-metoxy-1,4-benzoquinol methylase
MTPSNDLETAVKACYSTWSGTYYDDYYGAKASYPPVHRELIRRLLRDAGARTLLDAGCGPASFLRELADDGIERYGFDVTPEMVREARRVLGRQGVPPERIWEGSVLTAESFRQPGATVSPGFDAAVCVGVLPHVPAEADEVVIRNLRGAVRPGGLVVLEARNQLFALFTLNRYSHQFFLHDLIRDGALRALAGEQAPALDVALEQLQDRFRLDLPPVRKGKAGEPGYDEVLSRTHNPLVLRQQAADLGLADVRVLFYHYHSMPPMLAAAVPDLFRRTSLAMESPEDWRGYFMASAFLIVGRRA